MTSTPVPQELLWPDGRIESALMWVKHRGLTAGSRAMLKQMSDEYEAKLRELEAALLSATLRFETAKECADIMGKQLEEARATLRANGIYDDEGV